MDDWLNEALSFLAQFSSGTFYMAVNLSMTSFVLIKFLHMISFETFVNFNDKTVLKIVRVLTCGCSLLFTGSIYLSRVRRFR